MDEARRRTPDSLGWVAVSAVYTWMFGLLVVPLVALVAVVGAHPGEALAGLLSGEALHAILVTLALTVVALVVNGGFGVVGALVLVRQRFWGRSLLDALVDLPLALSPVMTGLAFLLLFGRTGPLRPVLDALGLQVAFAFPGILLATLFVTLPFTLREVALVLEELGTSEEDAAATLGATGWQTFVRITLPNLRHALSLGGTLTVARSLGEFGAVLVVGGAISNRTMTATTFVHAAIDDRNSPAAYGMALLLVAAAMATLAFLQRQEN